MSVPQSPRSTVVYYAWGETDGNVENYSDSTYKWNDGNNAVVKYCTNGNDGIVDNKTTLDPEDDVACIKWGSNWRMPTIEEQNELRDSCIWRWTKVNDVNGFLVAGPNGNSIFLQAVGLTPLSDVL